MNWSYLANSPTKLSERFTELAEKTINKGNNDLALKATELRGNKVQ